MSAYVEKVWGGEFVLVNEPEYCAKELVIAANRRCSLHRHHTKKETFIVKSGVIWLEQSDVRGNLINEWLKPGDQRTIEPGTLHRFSSVSGGVILEVSTHHDDADVVRLEPSGPLP